MPAAAPVHPPTQAHPQAREPDDGYRSGAVTRLHEPAPPDVISIGTPDDDDPAARNRRMLRWFGGGAAAVIAIGVVIILAMVMTGSRPGGNGLFDRRAEAPSDTRPELAKLCPPPSGSPENRGQQAPPPKPGPRTVDDEAGISYAAYGAPWEPWNQVWTGGDLKVVYSVGQHFITEENYSGASDYHASILSGSVPATVNDAMVLDLKCTGQQVVADVRGQYYPKPNSIETISDEFTNLGGRQAWVSKFRVHFNDPDLRAKDELVGVAMIDVGRPEAAILYVSIPGTHRQFDWVLDDVLASVRPV